MLIPSLGDWSVLDLSMSAPKFIRISHSHPITKSMTMTILIRCHSIRFSFRICLLVLFFVFLFFCFLFSVSVFPFCFVYFRVVVIFYCFLVLFRLCVFYFHFLRNFIYFAVAAVAILHFALPLLPRSLSASASALLDHSFSISLHRPRSPALLLSCSVPPLAFSSCRLCAFCKLSWRQRRVSVQVPALQMSTHAARYTIRSCTPYCIRRVYWHLQSINTYR